MVPRLTSLTFLAFDKNSHQSMDSPSNQEMVQLEARMRKSSSDNDDLSSASISQVKAASQMDESEMDDIFHETFGGKKEK